MHPLVDQVRLLIPVLDDSPIGFAVFDHELRYIYVNDALARHHGRSAHEHIGRTMAELFSADHVAAVEPPIREVLSSGRPHRDVALSLPTNGGPRHFSINRYPVHDLVGELLGVAVTVQDVTEARRVADLEAETARLRENAELAYRLEAAQRIAGFGSWEFDLRTGRALWSRQLCAITGAEEAPRTEAEALSYVYADDVHVATNFYRTLVDLHRTATVECRVVRRGGRVITVRSTGEPVFEDGALIKIWGTTVDVSAQRAVEESARRAERAAELANAELAAEHAVLQMFQRSVLPETVPEVPGAQLAVAYQPITQRIEIGGDWYDAFGLAGGRVALVVGDVSGHDLRAATAMSQVRNAVRAYALEDPRPCTVLQRTSAFVALLEMDLVTMLFGVYDPGTASLAWSRAGHPPPVLRTADGSARSLDGPKGMVLGYRPADRPYPEDAVTLAPGDLVLWYTDGLIERRGYDMHLAVEELRRQLAADPRPADAERLVRELVAAVPAIDQEDDICLLALRRD
ncbi:MAG TPA: SpoIIE family protein phosphatase [Pilimelia sp.]|nr:SpoIIE family protein phosphatase [Pilimelia sp.]